MEIPGVEGEYQQHYLPGPPFPGTVHPEDGYEFQERERNDDYQPGHDASAASRGYGHSGDDEYSFHEQQQLHEQQDEQQQSYLEQYEYHQQQEDRDQRQDPQQDQQQGAHQDAQQQLASERRRSRWGRTVNEPTPARLPERPPLAAPDTLTSTSYNGQALPPPPLLQPSDSKPRHHRWGQEVGPDNPPVPDPEPVPPPGSSAEGGGDGGDGADESARKRRRSRWETEETCTTVGFHLGGLPKEMVLPGAIRVVLPSHLTGEGQHQDPKLRTLQEKLSTLNRKLAENDFDIPPEGQRSPSPEPVYDRNGMRLNTREMRCHEKMVNRRNAIVEELIKEDPAFKAPADYKPRKYTRKIYIPIHAYPNYNFIGLIIGPRGNTQKRMQKETNTKIAIRGRGSVKEGSSRDPNRYDYGEDEELHVLITGETEADVDNAAEMMEKLMEPVDEARNEHKRLQLRELAALNGTLKDEQPVACFLCGEMTHRSYECPKQKAVDIYTLPADIKAKVDEQYQRDVARMAMEKGLPAGVKMEDEYKSFLSELGGAPPPELMGLDPSSTSGGGGGGRVGGPGLGARPGSDLPDDCKLYVGNLSPVFSDQMLASTFEPFGTVLLATVIMDSATGMTRGYGFVHMADAASAKAACEGMHGRTIDGRSLVVRLRSDNPALSRPKYATPGLGSVPAADNDDCKLYVGNLPAGGVTEDTMRAIFEPYGQVVEVKLISDRLTGQPKPFCFVTMSTPAAAQAAMRGVSGYKMDGRNLTVKPAGNKRDDAAGRPPGADGATPPARPPGTIMTARGPAMPYPPGAPQPPAGAPPVPPPYPGGPPPPPYAPPPSLYPGYYPPPGAPPPGAPPPTSAPPHPGHMAPPPGYGVPMSPYAAPPPYGAPPPVPYGAPPGYYPPPAGYGPPPPYGYAPPPVHPAPHDPYLSAVHQAQPQLPPSQDGPLPPHGYAPPPLPQQPPPQPHVPPPQPPLPYDQQQYSAPAPPPLPPPMPSSAPPPLPPGGPPPPPTGVQSEYEKFMSEMQRGFTS